MSAPITLAVEGILLNWLVEVGDAVEAGTVVAEIEADKATVEIEAPVSGVLSVQDAEPGDELMEGAVIGQISADADVEKAAASEPAAVPKTESETKPEMETLQPIVGAIAADAHLPAGVKITPLARKMAADRGIDLKQLQGTGFGGRIVKDDVARYQPSSEGVAMAPTGADSTYEDLPLSRMRERIGEGTSRSKREAPHFYVSVEVDVASLTAMRAQWNESQPIEQRLSINDLLVKAAALTLRDFPNLNSHYLDGQLRRFHDVNIGISVALESGGLINVVAQAADRHPIGQLAANNRAMIARAREGRIRPSDVQGATFTISNLGPYGVLEFSAIIDPPQAAILAVSAAQKVPVVREDGSVGVGERLRLTLSADHRVSDGAEAASYLRQLRQTLEAPLLLFL